MNFTKQNILYISYDGMTDSLGQSQVLPYIIGLTKLGFQFTLISCEKKDKYLAHKSDIEEITAKNGIDWQPILFTSSPPFLAKYYDIYKITQKALALHKVKCFIGVHCRSYVSAAIGYKLKRQFGIKFIFDMRGFWVDERVDAGNWNLKNPFFYIAYKVYKSKERDYIRNADAIISLTEKAKSEIKTWESYSGAKITVIPCSADFELFELSNDSKKSKSRQELGLFSNELLISYLGSIGSWYLLDEMLELFSLIKRRYSSAKFLFITHDNSEVIFSRAAYYGLSSKDFLIKSSNRNEVPFILAASDINLFFIKQSYSKIASSPTKLGEVLALGIPVICNSKVGDVKEIVNSTESGIVLDQLNEASFLNVVDAIPSLLAKDKNIIRQNALKYYNLEIAVERYNSVYKDLFQL